MGSDDLRDVSSWGVSLLKETVLLGGGRRISQYSDRSDSRLEPIHIEINPTPSSSICARDDDTAADDDDNMSRFMIVDLEAASARSR